MSITALYLITLLSPAELKFRKIIIVQHNIILVSLNQEQRNSRSETVLLQFNDVAKGCSQKPDSGKEGVKDSEQIHKRNISGL